MNAGWGATWVLGLAAAAIVGGPLLTAESASATTAPTIEVSPDGVTYGPTFPGSLFGEIRLIPGSSDETTIWVRNPTAAEAYLRVVLTEVVATDLAYWGALSVRTTVADSADTVPMPAPDTCTVLANAVPLAAGEAMPVVLALSLGNLDGTRGQNGRADFTIGVTLSEVAYPAADCATPAVGIPATPGAPSGGSYGGSTIDPVGASPQDGAARGSHQPFRGLLIDFNTGRVNPFFLVAFLGSGIALGAGWFLSLARKRAQADDHASTPQLSGEI